MTNSHNDSPKIGLNRLWIKGVPVLTILAILTLTAIPSFTQSSKEFFSGSLTPATNGPTTAAQTGRLLLNTNNPTGNTIGATNTTVNVTAALSNQQFAGVNTGAGNPVVMFGATITNGSTTPTAQPTFQPMNAIGAPLNTNFTNTPSGSAAGMDVGVNHAFNMFTSVRQWPTLGVGVPLSNTRVYMANLTLTFSSPVTNPVLQFVGMGGTSATTFSSELTLTSPGLSLTKLQGNTSLAVTATQINNNNATGMGTSCTTNVAGCGTVRVNGSNITTIAFQVFVRGGGPATSAWANPANHGGDQWLIGVSLSEAYTISGTVFNDTNGLGDGTVNGTGTGTASLSQLYANLVDPTDGTIIGSVAVAANGTYTFTGVPGGGVNYRVDISTTQGTALAAAPARTLPTVWNYTGENVGAGPGSDGIPNGALNVTVGTAAVVNANFGIRATVTAAGVGVSGQVVDLDGRPITNARLRMTSMSGDVYWAVANPFGYFRFVHLPAGTTYVLEPMGKGKTFEPLTIALNDDVNGLVVTPTGN